ncbi:hypothetical protein FIV02_21570 [Pseudomonas sp. THAF187a]|uniref:ABC-three component system protein n=1 Tax=unclassified Pseudomonas TaxID=196821 RepID=UPI00126865EC|nr:MULTISPECIES: ABC-three component system protein [unclassified Pseudomonas]QFT24154.1 hypothetical protein FIV02_21570 [Pseudomonas sp. THAF187a]QFT44341.1 hypothetical protein FIU98_21550 [Pseudomonas sp. THAF42]
MARNDIEASLPHTAVATWGGYIYQGKVALYHCLTLILDDLDLSENLSLQLDSIDDFAVLLGDTCQSIHQVKAYKSEEFSSYESAITEQIEKATNHPNCSAFLHVSKKIKLPDNFISNYLPVSLYEYKKGSNSESYCALAEIDALLENTIKQIYARYHTSAPHKLSTEYLDWSRNLLEDIVVKKVIAMHSEIQLSKTAIQRQVANREKIEFKRFISVLEQNLTSSILNEEYFFSVIIKDLGIYFSEFCDDNDLQGEELEKLSRCVAQISQLDTEGLKSFIRSILPNKKGQFSSLVEYKDEAFTSNDLQLGLFRIFHELVESTYDPSRKVKNFFWSLPNGDFYPTAIHQGPSSAGAICKRIVEGAIKHDVEFLYESGTLITSDINAESIYSVLCVGARSESYQEHSKFNKFKEIALVSIANIPDEIKK